MVNITHSCMQSANKKTIRSKAEFTVQVTSSLNCAANTALADSVEGFWRFTCVRRGCTVTHTCTMSNTYTRDLVCIHSAEPNPPICSSPSHHTQWKISLWRGGQRATSETTHTHTENGKSIHHSPWRQKSAASSFTYVTPLNLYYFISGKILI